MANDIDPIAPPETGQLVGYARISTDDQKLDLQMDALTRHGVLIANIHTDQASGKTVKGRPGFEALCKDLRRGDILVVWKLDRIGRDIREWLQTADWLKARGVTLRSLTEQVDTTTPYGQMMFTVMGAFAQLERDLIIERTKAGQAAARKKGRFPGRKALAPEKIEAIRQAIEDGKTIAETSVIAECSIPSVYRYLKEIQTEMAMEGLR